MWLGLSICSLLVAVSVHGLKFKKCCPEGEVAFLVDDSLPTRFKCKTQLNSVKTKSVLESENYEPKNVLDLHEMVGYNFISNGDSHWPSCSIIFSKIIENSLKTSVVSSCVDIIDGHYNLFSCDDSVKLSEELKNVYKIKKCCGKNYQFDILLRKCVFANSSEEESSQFDFFGNKSVIFEIGIPDCNPDDVLVEYRNDLHKLKIDETSLTVTATDHGPDVFTHGSYCIENAITLTSASENELDSNKELRWISKVCRSKDICSGIPCLRKCCRESLKMVKRNGSTFCEPHDRNLKVNLHLFNGEKSPKVPEKYEPSVLGILMPKYCKKYKLNRDEDVHFVSANDGTLFLPDSEEFLSNDVYCVDYLFNGDKPNAVADDIEMETFVCLDEKTQIKHQIYASFLAVSAFFLAATFFVYIFLPKFLNLHGKTLVSHVFSLFIAYSFLSVAQFGTYNVEVCKSLAFILYFSFLSAFSWLNVMCLDIFYTICFIRTSQEIERTREFKRFICYSLYAWGFPCIMTVFTYLMDTEDYNFLPMNIKPNIGKSACWFENSSLGHIVFFLVPVGLQISVNIVLFIITAIHCNRVKREIHRMQMSNFKTRRFIADKEIFLMNLKLFIVMGISWLLEILATLFNEYPSWWLVSDGFNLLQGVLIFFIFVIKRSVLLELQKKLGTRPEKEKNRETEEQLDLQDVSELKI